MGIAAGLGVAVAGAAWATLLAARTLVPGDAAGLDAVMRLKAEAAARASGPRIMVVAGSNAYFGVSTAMIAEETGTPCFNLGSMVTLGLAYITQRAERSLHAGDLVLLPLEYQLYVESERPSQSEPWMAVGVDAAYLRSLEPARALRVLLAVDLGKMATTLPHDLRTSRAAYQGFAEAALGPTGDTAESSRARRTPENLANAVASGPMDEFFARAVSAPSRRRLADFVGWCRAHRVTPVATFPNAVAHPAYRRPATATIVPALRALYRDLGVPLVGSPAAATFPQGDAFNSPYHPTAEWRAHRTRRLLADLAPVLAVWRRSLATHGSPR